MWRSTWNPRSPHHKIYVHCLIHVQPLLWSLECQTAGTEPRLHPRGLACQIPQHPSVAADWFRGNFRCEANCNPGSVWCESVGYIIYCYLQQQWSQIFPLQAGKKNQGKAIQFFKALLDWSRKFLFCVCSVIAAQSWKYLMKWEWDSTLEIAVKQWHRKLIGT